MLDCNVDDDESLSRWNEVQKNWFISVLNDTLDSQKECYGYHVIIGVHYPPFVIADDNNNTFQSLTYKNPSRICSHEIPDIVNDFIENGGVFITWLAGHTHIDCYGFGKDYPNQFTMTIAGSYDPVAALKWDDSARIKGTVTDKCFCIVGINTYTMTVNVLRIGSDTDRYMRSKKSFSYDYRNKNIIYIN